MTRQPALMALASTAVLLALAAPVLGMHTWPDDAGSQPAGNTVRQAYDLVTAGFGPGANATLIRLVLAPAAMVLLGRAGWWMPGVVARRGPGAAPARQPVPAGPVPGDTVPDDTGPDDTGPDDTGPDDTGPDDTGPDDTGPDDTAAPAVGEKSVTAG